MSELSHSARRLTVRALIVASARRLARAKLYFGHGTDNAADEAASLVWHVLKLPYPATAASYARLVSARARGQVQSLIERRIRERIPAAYLIGRARFAGLIFHVDARVLIPRSPLAELIERRFAPWIELADRLEFDQCLGFQSVLFTPEAEFPVGVGRIGRLGAQRQVVGPSGG